MKAIARLLGAALIAVSLVACQMPDSANQGVVKMQLKLYQVPTDRSQAIAKHLGAVLEDAQFRAGLKSHTSIRVTQPFPGAVMVLAPVSLQPSIGAVLATLDKRAGEVAGKLANKFPQAVPVRVHFWMVQAKPGKGNDAPQLAALEPTLARVRESLGPSHFVLNEAVSSVLNAAPEGDRANTRTGSVVTNRRHQYEFTPNIDSDGAIVLEVQYVDAQGKTIPKLESTISVQPGQYVVLAEAPSDATGGSDDTLMNLLVVRVDRLTPAKS